MLSNESYELRNGTHLDLFPLRVVRTHALDSDIGNLLSHKLNDGSDEGLNYKGLGSANQYRKGTLLRS